MLHRLLHQGIEGGIEIWRFTAITATYRGKISAYLRKELRHSTTAQLSQGPRFQSQGSAGAVARAISAIICDAYTHIIL